MMADQIVLAGGGHSHALLLKRWAMNPSLRPSGLVTLISRNSTTLYSGMVPGLISGHYSLQEVEIDLRSLADKSGVVFLVGEIIGLDMTLKKVLFANRPPINFQILSLDIGAETKITSEFRNLSKSSEMMTIKPLEPALAWLNEQDKNGLSSESSPFMVVGAGLAGVELAIALRYRWPSRHIFLQAFSGQPVKPIRKLLNAASIELVPSGSVFNFPTLLCTGSKAPDWLASSGLPVDFDGRIFTSDTLQVIGCPSVFAVGDCAIIKSNPRPPSGVWAVRAARPLARNIENSSRGLPLKHWRPQKTALQLVGINQLNQKSTAWACFGQMKLGPHPFLWKVKKLIDRRFVESFSKLRSMDKAVQKEKLNMDCRGCAAKLPAKDLAIALQEAGMESLAVEPQDAVQIATTKAGDYLLQSVDGFPAMVSDPWLNGRLIASHACSDLWASGARVLSAQAVVELPVVQKTVQQELLSQTLLGIKSILELQGAKLLGGHTLEARSEAPSPCSLGVQLSLTVNGSVDSSSVPWS